MMIMKIYNLQKCGESGIETVGVEFTKNECLMKDVFIGSFSPPLLFATHTQNKAIQTEMITR